MPIYDQPVRTLMRDMISDLAPETGRIFAREDALQWFGRRYPKIKPGTIVAHLTRFATNAPSRLHYGARPEEDLLFQVDSSRFRRYEPAADPPPIHTNADLPSPTRLPEDALDDEGLSEFAYESDLRDFLARNLTLVEPGLQLYQDEEITGVEFPAGGRYIDILAVDQDGGLVVIELKVSRGYDRVVGQLLRYMGWIEQNHAEPGQRVRGVIAAREISQDLRLACANLADIVLYEYQLSVTLKRINA